MLVCCGNDPRYMTGNGVFEGEQQHPRISHVLKDACNYRRRERERKKESEVDDTRLNISDTGVD